jgi:putative ABC transport system permease protein
MSWWSRFVRRAALDRDLERELQDHLERRARALIDAGLTPAQAHRQALVERGGAEQVKEAVRDVRGTRWAHDLVQDVRFGARTLRRSPGLLIAALLSMGLGIGANAATFSLVDAIMLRALPVHDPGRLVVVRGGDWTNPIWEATRELAGPRMAGALAWGTEQFDLSGGGEIDPAAGLVVSGAFFDTLGVVPAAGRLLAPRDDRRGGGTEGWPVVLSHAFWQRRFQGDPAAIGRTLALDQRAFTIVGVAPPGFHGVTVGRTFDVAVPIAALGALRRGQSESPLDSRSWWWLQMMFRLRPGQTLDEATAALRAVQPQVRVAAMPSNFPADMQKDFLSEALALDPAPSGLSTLRGQYRQPLYVLMGIVGLVLLIACANIANLLLARAAARRHELAARLALGASPGRLVRQLVAESLVLAAPGAIAGLMVAAWGSRFLVAQLTTTNSRVTLELPLDWRLVGVLVLLSVATAVIFGLVPAWRARRIDAADAVSAGTYGRVTRRGAVSGSLVVGQVALSLVLVVAAGLFGRTFSALATRDLGFEPAALHLASVNAGRVDKARRPAMTAALREAALRVPSVTAAATSVVEPMSGGAWNTRGGVIGGPTLSRRDSGILLNALTPGWFATLGMRLIAGRDVDARDAGGPPIGVVNEAFVRRFVPDARTAAGALGRRVRFEVGPGAFAEVEIVGVVEDAAYRNVRETFTPTLYRPTAQLEDLPPFLTIAVRTPPAGLSGLQAALTRAIREVDPSLAITHRRMADRLRDQLTQSRTIAVLSSFFGLLALLLAAIGLYGITSYGVNERRREIGIRMTLGAGRTAAEGVVLSRVTKLVALGIALGLAATLLLSPIIQTLLYELEPRDPVTMSVAAGVLAIVGLLAGWLPARRAARIDPAQVLREG